MLGVVTDEPGSVRRRLQACRLSRALVTLPAGGRCAEGTVNLKRSGLARVPHPRSSDDRGLMDPNYPSSSAGERQHV